jgi:hypothetical protein
MVIYDLLKDTAEALAEDSEINAWCLATFGARAEILIDEDLRDPSSAAPAVRLHSPYKRAHQEQRSVEHGFFIYVLVNAAADTTDAHINLSEFAATAQLMTFLDMIIDTVYDKKPTAAVMEYELTTDTVSSFPYFDAEIGLQFYQTLFIGQDPLTV